MFILKITISPTKQDIIKILPKEIINIIINTPKQFFILLFIISIMFLLSYSPLSIKSFILTSITIGNKE